MEHNKLDAAPSDQSAGGEPKEDDDLHRWEIEPHPYDSSYDIMITDSDKAAAEAIQYAAEMYLWDGIETRETRTLKVTLNDVPNSDPPDTRTPSLPLSQEAELRVQEFATAEEFLDAYNHAASYSAGVRAAIEVMRERLTVQFSGFTNADELLRGHITALKSLLVSQGGSDSGISPSQATHSATGDVSA